MSKYAVRTKAYPTTQADKMSMTPLTLVKARNVARATTMPSAQIAAHHSSRAFVSVPVAAMKFLDALLAAFAAH